MADKQFRGTGVALITPFKMDGEIDWKSLEKLIHLNIDNGIDYFVSLGTTGESVTLTPEERNQVWRFTAKIVNDRVLLVAGLGGNNSAGLIQELKEFEATGYNAILSVSPFYNKPSQEGIYQHFMKIAESSPLPIIIYNVPERTASNISAETTTRLANASNKFIGVKEASGNFAQCMQIVKDKPENFLVISGDDIITLPMISFGIDGVISVVAQAFPQQFSGMVNHSLNENFSKARSLHFKLLEFMNLFFEEGSPAGVKAALHILGICENVVRLPLVPVSNLLYKKIESAIGGIR
jgi:4-hydroxy-tetrahydrodipicolinate synthase